LAPGKSEGHFLYGRWLHDRGRLSESQTQLEAAVSDNPRAFPARDLLTQVYSELGNRTAADRTLEETVKLAFNAEIARRYMAELARREAARFPPNSTPEILLNLSAKYCNANNYQDCLTAAQKAIDLRPNYAEAYNNMAAAYFALQRWDDGIEAARQ